MPEISEDTIRQEYAGGGWERLGIPIAMFEEYYCLNIEAQQLHRKELDATHRETEGPARQAQFG